MKPKDTTAAARMKRKRYLERAAGIIEVLVKVPAERSAEIKNIARSMLEELKGDDRK